MGSSTMTTPFMRAHQDFRFIRFMTRLCQAGLVLALTPFLAGWSPPVSVLGSPLYMFFGDPDSGKPDLRPLEMTPNDVATACVRYRNGTVSYQQDGVYQAFSLICSIPARKGTPAHRTRHTFLVVGPHSDHPKTALGKIEVYGSNIGKNRWVRFSEEEMKTMMKSIRDVLMGDGLIEGPEEGQDAFGHWRVCKNDADFNCYPKTDF